MDHWLSVTVTDEAPRLARFSHDNVAAAQAFIEGEKLYCVIRLTGYHGKNGQVAAANWAKQRITGRWPHFARLQQARNHDSRHYQQSDPSNHHCKPHNWASPAVKTPMQTPILPRTRDGLRVPLHAPPPRHAHPLQR